jgi:hypothetical protein
MHDPTFAFCLGVITFLFAVGAGVVMLRATWIQFSSAFPTKSNVFVFLLGAMAGACVSAAMWVSSGITSVFARGR